MSNLIAVAKLCFKNLRSSIGLSSASLYDRIDQSKADEYSRQFYRAGPPKEVSIVTPRKRRKAENPVRPVKRQGRDKQQKREYDSEDSDSDLYPSSGHDSAAEVSDDEQAHPPERTAPPPAEAPPTASRDDQVSAESVDLADDSGGSD